MALGGWDETMSQEEAMTMRPVSHQTSADGWLSLPMTLEGWWAAWLGSAAIILGALGEAARRGDVVGPFYPLAFLAGIFGGIAAVLAIRRGERSLLVMLAALPLLIAVGFGLAELSAEVVDLPA